MRPLMGTFNPSMEAKGRMEFPARLRDQLGAGFIVTVGFEGCLYVYSEDEFEKLTQRLEAASGPAAQQALRRIYADSEYPECDKQGRIQISKALRDHAGLVHDITVIGNRNRAEIWDSARYEAQNSKYTEEQLAEALGRIAF